MSAPSLRSTVLRIATAGSVDDGKSTLIGRLLYDSKSVFADQLEAIERTSSERGDDYTNLALLTDGLRAEREQGITIDVAYRYFATPQRKFIVADTPGHVQYTRNMVTGASTADVAIVLVDARKGVLEQSRRHAYLASLLRVPHVVLCVNKMDLVDYDEAVFDLIVADFRAFADDLDVADITAVPVSALVGDNVVDRSDAMPWYDGPSLLEYLETVEVASASPDAPVRFPVQYVIRPTSTDLPDYRGYAGQVASGVLRVGDAVTVLPSGRTTTVAGIDSHDGPLAEAFAPMSVVVRLRDDLDVSRGDLIAGAGDAPRSTQDVEATICWMSDQPLLPGARVAIKHTTRSTRAVVRSLRDRLDVTTLRHAPTESLSLNDIGRITLRTAQPLALDDYRTNRTTGSFIVIDEATGATAGAGMVSG